MALIDRTRWDLDALRAGGLVALVFAVPLSIGATWAADRDDGVLALWLSVGAVMGFVLGAGCAAWVQRCELPLTHGLATAIGTSRLAIGKVVANSELLEKDAYAKILLA